MQRFLHFIYLYRTHILFIILAVVSLSLVTSRNPYQGSSFFNSSNYVASLLLKTQSNIVEYFNLRHENKQLLEENKKLKQQLKLQELAQTHLYEKMSDTSKLFQYIYYTAKVINNSTDKHANYFTIDRGSKDGIKKGMSVVSSDGVAGVVYSTSRHFSTVTSLLNAQWPIYAKIKSKGISGILRWSKPDPEYTYFDYVAKHHKVSLNDTVVTHNYSSFPDEYPVGVVSEILDEGIKFNLKVKLFTDFRRLKYVYIIENKLKEERDELESKVKYKQ
ncbi:MAG: rod shape-determining protein MreC [Cytophagaceae bacterium]|nr:rod shape-determining protein MreC [Cytophagaceae bacterium]MDW8455690.1 rod shape-determining protein MreC [Cytophagaceae bacterium]